LVFLHLRRINGSKQVQTCVDCEALAAASFFLNRRAANDNFSSGGEGFLGVTSVYAGFTSIPDHKNSIIA